MNVDISAHAVRPAPGHLVVKLIGQPNKTAGGLEIPDTAFNRPQYGTVLAVGGGDPEVRYKNGKPFVFAPPIGVEVGDVVLYIGYEMLLEGNRRGKPQGGDVLLMKHDSVVGVVNGDDLPEHATRAEGTCPMCDGGGVWPVKEDS